MVLQWLLRFIVGEKETSPEAAFVTICWLLHKLVNPCLLFPSLLLPTLQYGCLEFLLYGSGEDGHHNQYNEGHEGQENLTKHTVVLWMPFLYIIINITITPQIKLKEMNRILLLVQSNNISNISMLRVRASDCAWANVDFDVSQVPQNWAPHIHPPHLLAFYCHDKGVPALVFLVDDLNLAPVSPQQRLLAQNESIIPIARFPAQNRQSHVLSRRRRKKNNRKVNRENQLFVAVYPHADRGRIPCLCLVWQGLELMDNLPLGPKLGNGANKFKHHDAHLVIVKED